MPYEPEVEAARKAVFELIGHNVLRFQRFELLLKHLLFHADRRIPGDGPQPADWRQSRETLGTLAGRTSTQLYIDEGTKLDDWANAQSSPETQILFRYAVRLSPVHRAEAQKRLKRLVETRNRLVHGSLLYFDLQSAAGCAAALAELEQQAEDLTGEEKHFRSLSEALKKLLDHLVSEEGLAEMLAASDQAQNPNRNPA